MSPESGHSIVLDARVCQERPIDPLCMSSYLALRHLPAAAMEWVPGFGPDLPESPVASHEVETSEELIDALVESVPATRGLGLLLSGGIDSAILAALAPPGTPCLTIAFDAPGAVDESAAAAAYAARWGHPHEVVRIRWADYVAHAGPLMVAKRAPLHAIEVPLYVAARRARELGVTRLLVGNGADSNFGGMDRLLARDWSFDEFVERYQFADPARWLTDPRPIMEAFEPYRSGPDGLSFDVQGFLREIHGRGIVQSFENAVGAAGLDLIAPYELLTHRGELDLDRIRAGEPKYLVQEAFRLLYDTCEVAEKVPFARPMDAWLAGWSGPTGSAFLPHALAVHPATAEARWLLWCLDAFVPIVDGYRHG